MWGNTRSRSCWGRGLLGRPGLLSLLSVAGNPIHLCWCNLCKCALPEIAQRSYVMKELMSVGWDSQEKDKNMVEVVTSTNVGF